MSGVLRARSGSDTRQPQDVGSAASMQRFRRQAAPGCRECCAHAAVPTPDGPAMSGAWPPCSGSDTRQAPHVGSVARTLHSRHLAASRRACAQRCAARGRVRAAQRKEGAVGQGINPAVMYVIPAPRCSRNPQARLHTIPQMCPTSLHLWPTMSLPTWDYAYRHASSMRRRSSSMPRPVSAEVTTIWSRGTSSCLDSTAT